MSGALMDLLFTTQRKEAGEECPYDPHREGLEFVLHDQNYLPLFAIARTYSDWIGYKEFDLGTDDRVFYLEMVKDKKPGYVAVHAGFKTRQAR
jgi:hypothetical protein